MAARKTQPLVDRQPGRFWLSALATLSCAFLLAGCALSPAKAERSLARAASNQSKTISCAREDHCAIASPFEEAVARSKRLSAHYVGLLEDGEESLALRIHLIRAAKKTIALQTFIFTDDESGILVLNELLAAARRGVRVRVLIDQLFSLENVGLLAALASAHANFEIKMHNPTFAKGRTQALEFAAGLLCCFTRFNQRMHNKLMLIDGTIGITGGRNIDDRYFGWSPAFNYRDRDAWAVGPATLTMAASFESYWRHKSAVPLARLRDVARVLLARKAPAIPATPSGGRAEAVSRRAADAAWIASQFVEPATLVERVEYFYDMPDKGAKKHKQHNRDLSRRIFSLIAQAERRIVMQTPYLVLSKPAKKEFKRQRRKNPTLQIVVSTNSLASTDAFYVYAISHKYKRRYLSQFGFRLYEYKPFAGYGEAAEVPEDAPHYRHVRRKNPAPLKTAGTRRGLHAKSIVIDQAISLIGSHNFDPRSDNLNTESGLIVRSAVFAKRLEEEIGKDIQGDQSWVIAKRPSIPLFSKMSRLIERLSETLPLFDLWPFRYSASYELKQGCAPLEPTDPRFGDCYRLLGDFPEVDLPLKQIYTLIITAFGAGLTPIL